MFRIPLRLGVRKRLNLYEGNRAVQIFRKQKYLPQVKESKTQQMVSMSFVGLMFRPWASFSCRSATGRTLPPDIAPAIKGLVWGFLRL